MYNSMNDTLLTFNQNNEYQIKFYITIIGLLRWRRVCVCVCIASQSRQCRLQKVNFIITCNHCIVRCEQPIPKVTWAFFIFARLNWCNQCIVGSGAAAVILFTSTASFRFVSFIRPCKPIKYHKMKITKSTTLIPSDCHLNLLPAPIAENNIVVYAVAGELNEMSWTRPVCVCAK